MREIIFRGKRKDNGEWVYGSLSLEYQKECGCVMISPTADTCYKVNPDTVGQFTGLYDQTKWEELSPNEQNAFLHQLDGWENTPDVWTGKQIFEGDIVAFEDAEADYEGYHDNVFINRGVVGIYPYGGVIFSDRQTVEMDDLYDSETTILAKVVGNVYDNAEILEE